MTERDRAQSQSILARHGRRRLSWLGDSAGIGQGQPKREGGLPRGHRASDVDCRLCQPFQFRIPIIRCGWLFSTLKLSMEKDHHLHLRVHLSGFPSWLPPTPLAQSHEDATSLASNTSMETLKAPATRPYSERRTSCWPFSAGQPLRPRVDDLGSCIDRLQVSATSGQP